jgi:ribose-phosphate pyrophosphokinase
MYDKLRVFTGNANRKLAADITKKIGISLGKMFVGRFSDGEVQVKIQENVRGKDCFVIQPTCPPVNENLVELLVIIDALLRASAKRITAVMPYYGYGRQDRKSEPRVPISAKLVATLLTASGADRILSMDLHAGQIQGFFDIPVDHLYATPVFIKYFNDKKFDKYRNNFVVVAPDAGGVERARAFAKYINSNLAIVDKRRPSPNQAAIMNIIGEVKDKMAIILDDMVDTGGTLVKVAYALKKKGAKIIYGAASHGVLSGNAVSLIEESPIEKLIITDSIPLNNKKSDKIVVLSVSELLAKSIIRIYKEESVSELFI